MKALRASYCSRARGLLATAATVQGASSSSSCLPRGFRLQAYLFARASHGHDGVRSPRQHHPATPFVSAAPLFAHHALLAHNTRLRLFARGTSPASAKRSGAEYRVPIQHFTSGAPVTPSLSRCLMRCWQVSSKVAAVGAVDRTRQGHHLS